VVDQRNSESPTSLSIVFGTPWHDLRAAFARDAADLVAVSIESLPRCRRSSPRRAPGDFDDAVKIFRLLLLHLVAAGSDAPAAGVVARSAISSAAAR